VFQDHKFRLCCRVPTVSPILSDVRGPTLAIVCELCGRRGRYNVDRLMTELGDAKLTDLLVTLADCPKARSDSITDAPRHILATRIHLISRKPRSGIAVVSAI
jgi:hypothetical protein